MWDLSPNWEAQRRLQTEHVTVVVEEAVGGFNFAAARLSSLVCWFAFSNFLIFLLMVVLQLALFKASSSQFSVFTSAFFQVFFQFVLVAQLRSAYPSFSFWEFTIKQLFWEPSIFYTYQVPSESLFLIYCIADSVYGGLSSSRDS